MSLWRGSPWGSEGLPKRGGVWKGFVWEAGGEGGRLPTNDIVQSVFGGGQNGALFVPIPVVDGVQSLFQDSLGDVPVAYDGDPVGLMKDLSPNGNDAFQETDPERPIYRTDGEHHWLELDGATQSMVVKNQAFNSNNVLAAFAVTDGGGQGKVFDSRGSGPPALSGWLVSPYADNQAPRLVGQDESIVGAPGALSSSPAVFVSSFSSLMEFDIYRKENGGSALKKDKPSDAQIKSEKPSVLFSNSNGQNKAFFGGKFYGGLVSHRYAYADSEVVKDVEAYLSLLSGVTLQST